jgi:hypothetical protein
LRNLRNYGSSRRISVAVVAMFTQSTLLVGQQSNAGSSMKRWHGNRAGIPHVIV